MLRGFVEGFIADTSVGSENDAIRADSDLGSGEPHRLEAKRCGVGGPVGSAAAGLDRLTGEGQRIVFPALQSGARRQHRSEDPLEATCPAKARRISGPTSMAARLVQPQGPAAHQFAPRSGHQRARRPRPDSRSGPLTCGHTSRGGGIRTHDLFVPNHDTREFD